VEGKSGDLGWRRDHHESVADPGAQLDHPVIDADGHFVELAPVLDDARLASLEAEGGSELDADLRRDPPHMAVRRDEHSR